MRRGQLMRKVFSISGYVLLLAGASLIVTVGLFVLFGTQYETVESIVLTGSALLLMTIGFLLVKNFEADQEESTDRGNEESRAIEKIERVQKFLESDLPTLHRLIRRSESLFSDSLQRMSEEKQRHEHASESLLNAIISSLDDLWRISRQGDKEENDSFEALCRRVAAAGLTVYVPEERAIPDMNIAKIIREKESNFPRGTVVEVLNPGYRFGARIMREAEIVVASRLSRATGKKKS